MKFNLLKLLDVSILPAFLVISAKILGLVIGLKFLGLDATIANPLSKKPLPWLDLPSLASLNTFTYSFMGLVLVIGTAWLLILAHYFHETHIQPKKAAKIEETGLSFLIINTHSLYHRLTIWLSILWFVSLLCLMESLNGLAYFWMSIVLLTISCVFTYILAEDLEIEKRVIG